jgi:LysM repeat protein
MNRQFEERSMPQATLEGKPLRLGGLRRPGWQLGLLVAFILCAGMWLTTSQIAWAQAGGYNYTVQNGDSWESVASRTGVSVEALKAANEESLRENEWLLVGETLLIPSDLTTSSTRHIVTSGESWNSIAEDYGIPASLLRAANPNAIRSGNILYRGETLIIPSVGASVPVAPVKTEEGDEGDEEAVAEESTTTPTPEPEVEAAEVVTATETVEATEEPTVEPTVEPTREVVATVAVTETETMTATEELTSSAELSATEVLTATEQMTSTEELSMTAPVTDELASVSEFDLPACPERFADYSATMTDLINNADPGTEAVIAFLTACEALVDGGTELVDLNDDGLDELIVVFQNPSAEQIFVEGDLAIFNSGTDGYTLGYRARAAGEVRLLAVEDINLDELPDVAWVDTTCGASTCFDTVNVRSWDGTTWADWTNGTVTMAYAEINLTESLEEGLGDEVVLEGGIYGSVGAGPQRSRTEVWASLEGAPYSLFEKSYAQSECLYHTVLDANREFLNAPVNGFEAATALYTQAVTDGGLVKCWVRNDELVELRSFSQFRLAVIAGYSGDSEGAAAQIAELSEQYPGSIYDEVGQLWLESYETENDAALACDEVVLFAEENSAAWELLADYGYTNPSFEAVDVCPILDLSVDAEEESGEETEDEAFAPVLLIVAQAPGRI